MAEHKVRVTMQPDVEITVGDAELVDLDRNGLLVKPPKNLPEPTGGAPKTEKKEAN